MQKAPQPKLRYPRRASVPWFSTLLIEARRSDLAAVFTKTPNRRKSENGRRETIHLLMIILVSIVAVIVGLYAGVTSSHHHEH